MTKSLVGGPDCNLTALFHNPEASAIIKRTKSDSTCKHIRGKKKKKKQNVTVNIRNPQGQTSAWSALHIFRLRVGRFMVTFKDSV